VLTLAGLVGLFVLAEHTDKYFAWTIRPPLTAAFLGAGYGAGTVLVVQILRAEAWAHARLGVLTILMFTALTLLATVLHLDRFHFSSAGFASFAAWFWTGVYVVIPLSTVVLLAWQRRVPGEDPELRLPLSRRLRVALLGQGAVMLAVGAILFASPAASRTVWPWTLTPLTSRMVGAWLLAFGLAALLAVRERDLDRLQTSAVTYTVFGLLQLLALARYGSAVRWDTVSAWVYLALVVTVVAVGADGMWSARRARAAERERAAVRSPRGRRGGPPAAAATAGRARR
jgi:hypothetical protein